MIPRLQPRIRAAQTLRAPQPLKEQFTCNAENS